jgi:nitrite reductase/ring-hydroxylating ferredoxin subunit
MNQTTKPWRQAYAGYHHPVRPAEDTELTHVGPGTPCGDYLRRFWHPIAMTNEVSDLPLPVRILGEDLVLFKDLSERYGLLHRHCAHRGTSLEYGIPQQCGIRCCYHGWTYDIDGRCLATPGEPPTSTLKDRVFQGAYPVKEVGGLVFAYMGPPNELPDFPLYDTLINPSDNELVAFSLDYPCNWLQIHENTIDVMHHVFLHAASSGVQFTPAFGALPVFEDVETPIGLLSVSTRRLGEHLWSRLADMIMPNLAQFGSAFDDGSVPRYARAGFTRWVVPVDDTNSLYIGYRHFNPNIDPEDKGRREDIGRNKIDVEGGQTPNRPMEERRREPGDYEALTGQGDITVHGSESLASSDKGVIWLRRLLRDGIEAVQKGEPFKAPRLNGQTTVASYIQHVIHPVAKTEEDERELLARFGRKLAEISLNAANDPAKERQANVAKRVAEAFPY